MTTSRCCAAAALLLAAAASTGVQAQESPGPNPRDPHPHLKTPLPKLPTAEAPRAAPTVLLAPKLGVWVPTSRLKSALYTALQADVQTPVGGGALSVGLELSWTRPKYAGALSDPQLRTADTSVELGASQFGFTLLGIWRFGAPVEGLVPYLGGGPGLYVHRVASTAFGENTLEKESKLGLALLGGAEYTVGPGAAFLELQGRLARVDFVLTGFTSLGGLGASAGYRFRL